MVNSETKNKTTLIYITASGHSGSTVLDMLLGAHSKVVGLGEVEHLFMHRDELSSLLCTCKRNPYECPVWADSARYMDGLKTLSSGKLDVLEANEGVYEKIAASSGKNIIVDSSKIPGRLEMLLGSDKLNIITVHLVRDGRGVLNSHKKKYGVSFSPIRFWLSVNLKIESIKKKNKDKDFIFVKYEDFIKNPRITLGKILNMAGLEFEEDMLYFRNKDQHQIGGNGMRFREGSDLKEDRSWEKNLAKSDKLKFYILAGWLNKLYGY